jgi:hypothetical protein
VVGILTVFQNCFKTPAEPWIHHIKLTQTGTAEGVRRLQSRRFDLTLQRALRSMCEALLRVTMVGDPY